MSTASASGMAGKAMTVKGPIDPENLGVTLMHEHLLVDSFLVMHTESVYTPNRFTPITEAAQWHEKLTLENLHVAQQRYGSILDAMVLTDEKMAAAEASEFRDWGGSTIVDVTNIGIGRDPRALLRMSIATGLNMVMGCSWYVPWSYPDDMDERTVEDLTDEIVRDVTVGVGDTGIRAGIIGEVGIGGNPNTPNDSVTPNEIKVTRASARASRTTGAAITIHWGGMGREKLEMAGIIEEEGGDLTRTIFGHSDLIAGNMPLMLELLKMGVCIQFDCVGRLIVPLSWEPLNPEDPWAEYLTYSGTALVADAIPKLIEAGYADRILIAQDIATKLELKCYGGTGYSFFLETFLPHLRRLGVTEEDINQIVVENPKRLLTFVEPQ